MQASTAHPLRILFVDPAPFMGGAQTSLLTLIKALKQLGCQTTLACASQELADQARQKSIPCHSFTCRHWKANLKGLWQWLEDRRRLKPVLSQLIQDLQPDLIHLNTVRAPLILPHVTCPTLIHDRDLKMPAFLPALLARSHHHVVAISQAVAKKWQKLPVICEVIYNPVEIPPHILQLPQPPELPFTIIQVADLIPWKNHALFIKTVAELKKDVPQLKAVIRGRLRSPHQKPYLDTLTKLIHDLNLEQTVELKTQPGPALQEIQQAHLLVSTALHEPLGRTPMEALAMGKPVVAINSGGLQEILSNCRAASLISPMPEHSLTKRLSNAIRQWQSSHSRQNLGKEATTKLQELTPRHNAERILKLYQKILQTKD